MGSCQSVHSPRNNQPIVYSQKPNSVDKIEEIKEVNNLDKMIICQSCKKNFSENEFIPKNLPCGHTICSICILNIKEKFSKIKCPFDNTIFEKNSIFPTSFAILDLMKNSSKTNNVNERNSDSNSMTNDIHKLALIEIQNILTATKCIISDTKLNDSYIKKIAKNILEVSKKKYVDFYFSVKIFLFSKIYNYCLEGISSCPIKTPSPIYTNCKFENNNWICHAYILGIDNASRKFLTKQPQNFPFLEEDIKQLVVEEMKTALKGKKYYNNEEAMQIIRLILDNLLKNLKNVLNNYCFSLECVLKMRTEGMVLTKEADYLMKGIDGTTWIAENLNEFYSFLIFITVFKI